MIAAASSADGLWLDPAAFDISELHREEHRSVATGLLEAGFMKPNQERLQPSAQAIYVGLVDVSFWHRRQHWIECTGQGRCNRKRSNW